MLQLDGKTLYYGKAFVHENQQYPSNWLNLTSMEEKRAIGIVEVADAPVESYDTRFYWAVDTPKQLNDVTDENGDTTTGLKTSWKEEQDRIAQSLLSPSDWRVIKAAEVTDYAVSSQWLTYRAAIRTACNTRQSEIDACSDVEALKELLFGQPTITRQQTDSEGAGVVDSDGNPVMETVANPAIATAWPTPIEE